MGTTLIITNDFPPRQGGIETFVHAMATRVPDDDVVVYTSREPGQREFDATLPFPVIRDRSRMLLPTRRVGRRAAEIMTAFGCDRVWFGAAAPLAAMAPTLRRAGARRVVATTHGHEIWWAYTPGARQLLRGVGNGVDVVTYLGDYTRDRIAPALGPRSRLSRLVPGVDVQAFRPDSDPTGVRDLQDRLGIRDRRVVLCVSRLVARKGQDVLIRALPLVQRVVPEAVLVLVGKGPQERRLRALARRYADGSVVFAGGVDHTDTAVYYSAADVFAMPCRTRKAGLEAEGLGIVFLEAQASGLPVIAGNSGGAPDTVLDAETGHVVDGRDVKAVAEAIALTLLSPERADMGAAGRRWVEKEWTWDASARHLAALLTPTSEPAPRQDGSEVGRPSGSGR
ncbi:glycosyltransferase family 4 protein [Streptomyces sp. N50]|uniref:glycosyltransferase family 4 protein n=1 Tax=Streptomyces sp. N50 TaxID=3081765 RepID=UPI0029620982|nr:glycosyltransferase family 4 protein [Streptomyces sp. N50]WOX15485.1 glycosyltransferase family 4 protein [Streptomyces sp. N50]